MLCGHITTQNVSQPTALVFYWIQLENFSWIWDSCDTVARCYNTWSTCSTFDMCIWQYLLCFIKERNIRPEKKGYYCGKFMTWAIRRHSWQW